MDPLIILGFAAIAVLVVLALPLGLRRKSWKWYCVGLLLSLAGFVLPLFFFFFSVCMAPDSKDACRNGWIDCFSVGKLALAPLVLWASAALYAVEIYNVADRTRAWIAQGLFIGAVISFVCLVFGFVTYGWEVWLLLAVPLYTAVWYILRAVQVIRSEKVRSLSLVQVFVGSLPFWAAGIVWSYWNYLTLPQHSPECFVVSAAARGHRKLVGPFVEVSHRGKARLATRQLATFWQFEELWRDWDPRGHTIFRRVYNATGPILARRVTSPIVADALYIALKPLEVIAGALITISRLWPVAHRVSQFK